ncbi:hypothetical protein B7755_019540 [Streptomyces sp. NBS 14/10]|uniref:hypothetical protein n=1 Tax=Streptomyces sp. NBS 14/10 TaxID=1945643 RepID=UPI00211B37F6|nr:hypothetical protein [Streptomyces sp. NBS 14/10]KAK1180147.1 hypothetical protein B7755_019540 [Streptomyces sp. NBS 14/10]
MHRTAPRLARIFVSAAVPVVLVAGCSSGSDKDSKDSASPSKSATPSPTPTVAAAKYSKLPTVCPTLSGKTIDELVPKAESKKGKELPSADANQSASCLWTGLNGFKYRQLTVSLKLFRSEVSLGSGDKRAQAYAGDQAQKAATSDGAKNAKTGQVSGIGDAATTVSTESKKDGDEFRNQTVVVRTANVVLTLEYNGAGYEDEKTPDPKTLLKDAETGAKEVVASIEKDAEKSGASSAGSGASSSAA